jgi:hypothetical protein
MPVRQDFSSGWLVKGHWNLREKMGWWQVCEDRVAAFLCANWHGTDRSKLFVMENAQKRQILKRCKKYASSVRRKQKNLDELRLFKSWAATLWSETARAKKKREREKKTLLLVDNCRPHRALWNLENIKLVFLNYKHYKRDAPFGPSGDYKPKTSRLQLILLRKTEGTERNTTTQ